MRTKRALLAAALLGLAANAAAASEIHRCRAPGGSITYQEQPCPAASEAETVSIPLSYPDHTAERDRLMQREAAMDARLLKRLEIEAAERIARDTRIARERELQAEQERAAANAASMPAYPAYIAGWPQRQRWVPRRPWASVTR
jgi:hypothetical protein